MGRPHPPDYHEPTDTLATVDLTFLRRVAEAVTAAAGNHAAQPST